MNKLGVFESSLVVFEVALGGFEVALGGFGVALGVFQENVPKSLWPASHLGVFVSLQLKFEGLVWSSLLPFLGKTEDQNRSQKYK